MFIRTCDALTVIQCLSAPVMRWLIRVEALTADQCLCMFVTNMQAIDASPPPTIPAPRVIACLDVRSNDVGNRSLVVFPKPHLVPLQRETRSRSPAAPFPVPPASSVGLASSMVLDYSMVSRAAWFFQRGG
jgi:hypothetical protein